ncbi:MAG: ribbon-helix-helix domain-containing protein [Pseudomonadota bacterium]
MLVKRSVQLSGHQTSIALEAAFWDEIDRICREKRLSRAGFIAEVDGMRGQANLASALRLTVLADLKRRAKVSS